ncbi:hypothetical protein MferCBS31731_000750 [Microsporum ferrugineum]
MTRVLDVDGSIGCSRCGVFKTMRWVYICTEDEQRSLSDEFIRGLAAPVSSSVSTKASTLRDDQLLPLNEWVSEAIGKGCYTDEEIKSLREQRAAVLESIRMQSTCNEEEKEQAQSTAEALRRSLAAPPNTQGIAARQEASEYYLSAEPGYHPEADHKTGIPPCTTSYCHYCRPSGCERSWQSLAGLCHNYHSLTLTESRSGKPVTSIFDIPMSEIRRPIPRRVPRYGSREAPKEENTDPAAPRSSQHGNEESEGDEQPTEEEAEVKQDCPGRQARPTKRPCLTRRPKFTAAQLIERTNRTAGTVDTEAVDEIAETEGEEPAEEKTDEMN